MNPAVLALLIPILGIGLGFFGVWTAHLEKMAKLRQGAGTTGDSALADEVRRLREEVETLRKSATDYDLAFDKRLDALTARMETMELRSTGRTEVDSAQTTGPQGIGRAS